MIAHFALGATLAGVTITVSAVSGSFKFSFYVLFALAFSAYLGWTIRDEREKRK